MCGIAGWFRRGTGPVPRAVVARQCDALIHRGPDDGGCLTDDDFGFGMRRLSILDIASGHQPMTSEDGRFSIVFNGEIFNHLQVRADLERRGTAFRTRSDTETILAAFIAYGAEAWVRLEGMFAIALWDRRDRRLTLVRDPLGIKPLYVTEQNGGIAFASEIRALRGLPDHRFDIDDRAVHDFFSFGHVRKPRSIFRQVRALDPGHSLEIDAGGSARTRAFWSPRFRTPEPRSTHEWIEAMREQLRTTTARHMQSDVPVGAFLSGGIDSSAILAAMMQAGDRPVTAFTVGYPGARIDETAAAAEIASHLGAAHVVVPLDVTDATACLPDVLRSYDEPFADMAAIPNWHLSRVAAQHVKVVLCGEGGDELFAGYKRHRNALLIERMRPVLGGVRPLAGLIDRLPATGSRRLNLIRQYAQRFSEFIDLPDGYQQFFAATQTSGSRVRRSLYTHGFSAQQEPLTGYDQLEAEYFPSDARGGRSALEQFLFADLTLNMPSAMLTRLDRASMAHSLEARVPFLSHKMVDWALGVPADLKLRGTTGKFILRQAIAPWLPASVLKRPKQGFQIPFAAWFRGRFGDFARDAWIGSGADTAGYLDAVTVDRLFDEHRRGEANHGRMLYAITVFALWWRENQATPVLEYAP